MKSPAGPRILRNVELHCQPIVLARSHPPRAQELLSGSPELVSAKDSQRAAAVAHDTAYSKGFAAGCDEGRRVGLEKGMAEADERVQEAIASSRLVLEAEAGRRQDAAGKVHSELVRDLGELTRNFESALAFRLEGLERDAVALAFEAVCRIFGKGVIQPEQVAGLVRTSMQALRGKSLLRVHLHPRDLEFLLACAEGRSLTGQSDSVEWLADANVVSGGCVFDTELGSVDARMDVQLSRLRQLWLEAMQTSPRLSETQA
jgi:flagellar assembly protein FliH